MSKAIFIDRDGTIIADKHFLSSPEGIEVLPGVADALRRLKKAGFLLMMITNQSGVGRGYFSENTVQEIHDRLQMLLKGKGVRLDDIFICPHHPDDGCECRKPKIKLFEDAIRKYSIDPRRSYAVGDKPGDVEAGKRAGCKTVFLGKDEIADYSAANFPAAVDWILSQ